MDKNLTPVLVTLCSQQRGEHGEADKPLRLICQGRMKKTQSGCMIRYQEVQNDEETGRPVSQDVLLHVQNDRVTMTRLGEYGTTMVFVKDTRFEGTYHTPFGELGLALFTTQVNCRVEDQRGAVHLEYQLDMQGNFAAVQVIDVTWTVKEAH